MSPLPGVIPSPNIWNDPDVYETENRGIDPEGLIERAMQRVHPWAGLDVLDVGCGNGYHLPRLAETARQVIGVEPHPPLVAAARGRVAALPPELRARTDVRQGTAQALPVPDSSIDVTQARWAYFFGPGCEPGLAELSRVVRRGGTAFVVDVDATRSTFGRWFARAWPRYDALAVERFWARQGWQRDQFAIRLAPGSREALAAVLRIEFTAEQADLILSEHPGGDVDYGVNLRWRHF